MSGFWSALVVVFVAELGDKTQLVALGFGARYRLAPVLGGMALAYLATSVLSVAVGAAAGEALPEQALALIGGLLFIGFAAWTLLDRDGETHDDVEGEAGGAGSAGARSTSAAVATVASAMFVAEFGDKTMLATASLASTRNPVAVFVGALLGIFVAGAVGALLGRTAGDRLPRRAVRFGSALLFAGFGIAMIVFAL